MFAKVFITTIIIQSCVILALGQLNINNVGKMIENREMEYDRNELISIKDAYNLKLNQIRSFVFSLFSESNQSESMLRKIERYKENDSMDGIRLKAEIEQFFESMAYTDEKISAIVFTRKSDKYNFSFVKKSSDPRILPNFLEMTAFEEEQFIKIYPYKNQLFFILKVNDPLSPKISNVGSLIISMDASFMEKRGSFLKENSLIELKNENGSLMIGDASKFPDDHFIAEVKNEVDDMIFTIFISKDQLKQSLLKMRKNQWTILSVVVLLNLFVAFYVSKRLSKRVKVLTRNMRGYQPGESFKPIPVMKNDEFTIVEKSFNQLTFKLTEYIQKEYILEIKAKETELYLLHSQVNPHFLSNMLEILRMQAIQEDQYEIAEAIYELSEIFRWNIRNKEMLVTLFEEIYYVELYLKLQKIRFPKMTFEIRLPEELQNRSVIKFTVQPIIENIFKHAMDKRKEVHILIEVAELNHALHVIIQDNGKGIPEEKLLALLEQCEMPLFDDKILPNIGIVNVNSRIRLMYGDEYGLRISSCQNVGTKVCLVFPNT
ncbi:sensor histidine kinase [Paenibacillus sp. Soil787]|uniref:sensor histidine kinase n=1 Tax=Paenibacillus sp. Soil787 TaxID=1736411 RepID=UPI00138EEAD5|nr:histidine kinase [Paenibacillus sp. Soil787]